MRRLLSVEGLRYAAILAAVTVLAGGAAFAAVEPHQTTGEGMYWAITTMTTVGYGDLSPTTTDGKVLAAVVMVIGIGFVAILTGAVAQHFLAPEIEEEAEAVVGGDRRGRARNRQGAPRDGRAPPSTRVRRARARAPGWLGTPLSVGVTSIGSCRHARARRTTARRRPPRYGPGRLVRSLRERPCPMQVDRRARPLLVAGRPAAAGPDRPHPERPGTIGRMNAAELRLFDDLSRTDRSPASSAESHFAFLNRVDRPYFAAVRDLLEDWFTRFPAEAQKDLRARFRSDDKAQCLGAFWELYLHETHRCLGFELERDPAVPGTTRRPDFLIRGGAKPFYLEATTITYNKREAAQRRREDLLVDLISEAFDPDFFVTMGRVAPGPTAPRRNEVIGPIERWLSSLDWESAYALSERHEWVPPEEEFRPRGAYFLLRAHPRWPRIRGNRNFPTIAAGPGRAGFHNEGDPIYEDLHDKASRYGRPDHPFVIAALCLRDFVEDRDVEFALYGPEVFRVPIRPEGGGGEAYVDRNPRGLWQRGAKQRATRVSAVLAAVQLAPYTVTRSAPTLWTNPWAAKPLEAELPWRTVSGDLEANSLVTTEATREPHEILGLPSDWPGPGRPFDD
jgi:hypothetical protein